jgi:hypothetical protein
MMVIPSIVPFLNQRAIIPFVCPPIRYNGSLPVQCPNNLSQHGWTYSITCACCDTIEYVCCHFSVSRGAPSQMI